MQRRAYALVGAAAAIAAAVGPLVGGLITTYLSWRVAFFGEVVIIAIVLVGSRLVHDVPYTGARRSRRGGRDPLGARHGRSRARDPRLAGGRRSRRRPDRRRRRRARLARLVARQAQARGQTRADRRGTLRIQVLPARHLVPDAPADRPRRHDDRAADLPPDGARVQRHGGGPVARAALTEHVRRRAASPARRRESQPRQDHPRGVLAARRRGSPS